MKPRVGFLGLGWIGQHRLRAVADAAVVDIAALADARSTSLDEATAIAPAAARFGTLEDLLNERLNGVVIATPSALHAEQTRRCLERGLAVFCQKPLARSRAEAAAVVEAARVADRLLGVDLCYRETAAARALRQLLADDRLGHVYAANLVFHNAYGPDKDWYYTRPLAGGGCVIDLGIHLVDQLLWLLEWPDVSVADSRLFSAGFPWHPASPAVEDFAHAVLEGPRGAVARVTCSWRAPAGRDADICIELFGTNGGARISNVNGSFYDFVLDHLEGTRSTTLVGPPDDWSGRAVVRWARDLADSPRYRPDSTYQLTLAGVLDDIYATASRMAIPAENRTHDRRSSRTPHALSH